MEQYTIKDGNPLVENVTISGAKNATLGILAISIMTDDDVVIDNLPDVRDTSVPLEAIRGIGVRVDRIDRYTVKINGSSISGVFVDDEYIRRVRASYYFIGALSGKYKNAQVPPPGGCNIGSRPIDQHVKGFRILGAGVIIERGAVVVHVIDPAANHTYLDVVSAGATASIMMAAALAEGQTILENAVKEPHTIDAANFLNNIGVNTKEAGTDITHIRGVNCFHGTEYSIIPDQIETDTFMYAAAAIRGDIMTRNVIPKHLETILTKLTGVGREVIEFDNAVCVVGKPSQRHTDVKTLPYPGFPMDMQPQMSIVLVLASGTSMAAENIFENRSKYVDELARIGSNIKVEDSVAVTDGVKCLTGTQVNAPDLRVGAALMIAGLAAGGYIVVDEIGYIQRKYECLEERLQGLGATIEKVDSDREIQKFKLRVG